MPSVRVNVSKFGRFVQLNDSATKFKRPWFWAMLWLVAASTASSKSRPKPIRSGPD